MITINKKIGQTVRSLQVRKGIKTIKGGGVEIDTDDDNFTHSLCRSVPFKDRNTKVCIGVLGPDVITPIKFNVDRFGHFRSLKV